MLTMPVHAFLDQLASREPVPSGGSTAALLGAFSCALGEMVCSLTVGKPKYQAFDRENRAILENLSALRQEFERLCMEDEAVLKRLLDGYKLPSGTEEERAWKAQAMGPLLLDASRVPLTVMETCARALRQLCALSAHASRLAVSDLGAASSCARACLESAALSVSINTRMMADKGAAAQLEQEKETLCQAGVQSADLLYKTVQSIIEG